MQSLPTPSSDSVSTTTDTPPPDTSLDSRPLCRQPFQPQSLCFNKTNALLTCSLICLSLSPILNHGKQSSIHHHIPISSHTNRCTQHNHGSSSSSAITVLCHGLPSPAINLTSNPSQQSRHHHLSSISTATQPTQPSITTEPLLCHLLQSTTA